MAEKDKVKEIETIYKSKRLIEQSVDEMIINKKYGKLILHYEKGCLKLIQMDIYKKVE